MSDIKKLKKNESIDFSEYFLSIFKKSFQFIFCLCLYMSLTYVRLGIQGLRPWSGDLFLFFGPRPQTRVGFLDVGFYFIFLAHTPWWFI